MIRWSGRLSTRRSTTARVSASTDWTSSTTSSSGWLRDSLMSTAVTASSVRRRPCGGPLECLGEHLQFLFAPDETRQATRSGHLQAGPDRPRADQFEDLHRLRDTLDRYAANRLRLDIAFDQPHALGRQQGGAILG